MTRSPDRMKRITVLLCDDHNVVRAGLRFLLEAAGDFEIVGEAQDGHQSVREARRLQPDVILLDLAMPLLNGMEVARQITKEMPSAKVLILSSYSDDRHVEQAIAAGASGYLNKEAGSDNLLQAIRDTRNGLASFSPAIATHLLKLWRETLLQAQGKPRTIALTSRENEVIQLIAEGYATKQIAGLLAISIKTAGNHRQSLMDKLNIHKTATLIRYAISNGVVESNTALNCSPDWPVACHADKDNCALTSRAPPLP